VIDKAKLASKVDMVENEIAIMKQCNHVNIVRLYEEYETRTDIYLIMELVKVPSLPPPSAFVSFKRLYKVRAPVYCCAGNPAWTAAPVTSQ